MRYLALVLSAAASLPLAATGQSIQFEDATAAAGISYAGQSWGASWGDFNGDGYYDLWSGNHGALPFLLINQQDGTFVDQAQAAIPAATWTYYQTTPGSYDMHGAVWIDFDKDGDMDLLQAADGGNRQQPNHLYVNDGGVFSAEGAVAAGVSLGAFNARMPLAYDWNADGLSDILISGSPRTTIGAPLLMFERNQATPDYTDVTDTFGFLLAGDATKFARVTDLDGDGINEITMGPAPNGLRVYEFDAPLPTDITAELGLSGQDNLVDAAFYDFDGDLDQDIFIVRGESTQGLVQDSDTVVEAALAVFMTERGFSFSTGGDVTVSLYPTFQVPLPLIYIGSAGLHPDDKSFTLSPDNPDHHGTLPHAPGDRGHFVGYDPVAERWTVTFSWDPFGQRNIVVSSSETIDDLQPISFTPGQATPADIFLHNDNGQFVEETVSRGFTTPSSGRSVGAGDFDNDGDVDLYVVATGAVANQPNLLYVNDGSGHFTLQPDAGGAAGGTQGRGDAAVVADYDNDGFLDVFVTNGKDKEPYYLDGPYYLFRNLGNGNHWLQLELRGTISQTSGTGAVVDITSGGQSQRRVHGGGVHFRAQDMQRVHFGLGDNATVERVDIRWPSGHLQRLDAVASDQILTVVEPLTQSDTDADGVIDTLDNCLAAVNPAQLDTDGDGYGNRCDADFNNDCVTNPVDLGVFKAGFFGTDPLLDLDGDGAVNAVDLGVLKTLYFQPPGPSGTRAVCVP